jgi:hypothetical protein
MSMISEEDLPELDDRVQWLMDDLHSPIKKTPHRAKAAGEFLEWVIYPDWQETPELDLRPIRWSGGLNHESKESLVVAAQAAAKFARSKSQGDEAALRDSIKALAKVRGLSVPAAPAPLPAAPRGDAKADKKADARDKFIYEKLTGGVAANKLRKMISQHPDWDLVETDDDVATLAKRFAQRNNLPPPE